MLCYIYNIRLTTASSFLKLTPYFSRLVKKSVDDILESPLKLGADLKIFGSKAIEFDSFSKSL